MIEGWEEKRLSDLADIQTGPFGSQLKNEQYITGGTPVVTVEHIDNFRIADFDYPSVTKADRDRLGRYLLEVGDIVFTRVGSVDLSAYVDANRDGWMFSSRMLRVRPDPEKIDAKFLSYSFRRKAFREYILAISVGATMPSINTEILESLPVTYPERKLQKAIAEVLSSLDDKIDLLHRQNATLEALAETLFRQTFIEEAQEDWEEVELQEIANIGIGRTPPRKEFHWFSKAEGDWKWLSIKDMADGDVFALDTAERLTPEAVERFNIPVIPKDTVVLSFKMTVGRVAISTEAMLSNEAIAHFKLPVDASITREFLFLFLKSYQYDQLGSTSSIVTAINSRMIKELAVALPPHQIMTAFQEPVEAVFNKILDNQKQIQTLEKLRDTLLPKLMSGEVRVQFEREAA